VPGRSGPGLWLLASLAAALTATAADAAGPPEAAGVLLHPGDDVAGIVTHAAAGTRFRFAAGVYRLLEIVPKDRDSFVGDPGAVLSGAQIVPAFARDGASFVANVDVAQRPKHGDCGHGEACKQPNDVFVDGIRQRPVFALSAVGPGRFFLDYAAHKLYLGSDPAGKTVELATARFAFSGPGEGVSVTGLVIEKYANAAQSGAIGGWGRPVRWTIENCDIRDNHGVGIEIGANTIVSHDRIRHNGHIGIGGGDSHPVIEDNEIADNNEAGYDFAWESGGIKITRALHALVKDNYVHDNHGPGIWSDMNNVDVEYVGNRVEDNDDAGIQHEISFDAVIHDNRLRGNGRAPHAWVWGAQILIQNSRDVIVRNNRVDVSDGGKGIILVEQRREPGPFGPHLVRDCTIMGNTIFMVGESGIVAGIATDYADSRVDRGGNRFDANTYRVPDLTGRFWAWPSWQGNVDFAAFQRRYGQEVGGKVAAAPAR
jgi:hypothetical protein